MPSTGIPHQPDTLRTDMRDEGVTASILPTPTRDRPRIFRLSVKRPDGKRRYAVVKCPHYERDPGASLLGLNAELAKLTLTGQITASSVIVPAEVSARDRSRLVRWPEAIKRILGEENE